MRILYFSRDYTTHDRRFLLKLAESRHEVYFLRLESDGIPYEKRPLPARIHPVPWPGGARPAHTIESWLRLMPELEEVIAKLCPDLIHAGPVQSCGFMVALTGFKPLLLVSWASDLLIDAEKDRLWRWLTGRALAAADWFLCDCQAVLDKARSFAPIADDRVVQFPWGIDLAEFRPGPDRLRLREMRRWAGAFIVLSTRTWNTIYGIDTLLEGFRLALNENPLLRLVLAGGGPLAGWVEEFITNHSLHGVVHRPGMLPHDEVADYFRAADAYVSCAVSDGSSISLLEALATGLPVIVSDIPGNREWVRPEVNGWVAAAGDASQFGVGVLNASRMSAGARVEMTRENRRTAVERADWERNIALLLNAYGKIEQWKVQGRNYC